MKRVIILLVLFVLCLFALHSYNGMSEITVDVLDIGKADCIFIDTGNHKVMIDTGEEENVSDIICYLESKNITDIDVLILSHFDKDHIGGAAALISKYGISTVLESSFSSDRGEYEAYHTVLKKKGLLATTLSEDYSFTLDECSFKVYVPKQTSYPVKEDNNASLIITMKHGDNRFLFCGDAMELRLGEFLEDSVGEFDYVKLPYHGKYLENYSEFLEEVKPKYGVITCSKKNPASEDTLLLLEQYGTTIYESENGNVYASSNGKRISVEQKI